ncbi:MAG: DoxX family protein [Candidatus Nanopelagicaceae bacterium]|jgi:uncharacterized membrane protein
MKRHPGSALGIFLVLTGIGHFIIPKPLDLIVPEFLPGDPRFWTYLSGVAEIAIGAMLISNSAKVILGKSIRLWGAIFALALFITVYTANIKMAIDWSNKEMPKPLIAYARLPLQFPLFYWAWKVIKKFK